MPKRHEHKAYHISVNVSDENNRHWEIYCCGPFSSKDWPAKRDALSKEIDQAILDCEEDAGKQEEPGRIPDEDPNQPKSPNDKPVTDPGAPPESQPTPGNPTSAGTGEGAPTTPPSPPSDAHPSPPPAPGSTDQTPADSK